MGISILPTLLSHRIDASGRCTIVLRIYCNRRVAATVKLNRKIEPVHWDEKGRCLRKGAENAVMVNALIRKRTAELDQQFLEKELQGVKLTAQLIKRIISGQDTGLDFIAYCRQRIPERYPQEKQAETRRSYFGELSKLEQFQQQVSFNDITPQWLSRYRYWLITERKNHMNTVWKAFKFINTMLNDARVKENPFEQFDRGKYQQGSREHLTLQECDLLHKLLPNLGEPMQQVCLHFLFMCYTGFRFQDAVKHFNRELHVQGDTIYFETQKSGTTVSIFIHKRLAEVLAQLDTVNLSNKEFNSYVKIICKTAGIDKNVTAHIGRHTFGATLARLDVPIEKAQALLGHRDRKSTTIYYHIVAADLKKEMQKWDNI